MSGSNETEKVAIVDDYRLLKNIKDDPDSYEYHSTKFHCLRPPLGQNDSDYKESDLAARLYFSLEHRLLCLLKIFTCDVDTISCFKQNHHHIFVPCPQIQASSSHFSSSHQNTFITFPVTPLPDSFASRDVKSWLLILNFNWLGILCRD